LTLSVPVKVIPETRSAH